MKTSIATTLSVAGILAAGGAAFALNTAVLSDSPGTAATLVAQTTIAAVPAVTPTLPAGKVAATDGPITPEPTRVSDTVTTYSIGSAGSVIIDTSSGSASVTDIIPAAGWTAEPARTEAGGIVKVHFTNGSSRIEFTARMTGGKMAVTAKTDALPGQSSLPGPGTLSGSKPSVPQNLSGDDDDREDNHHDDGHEDEDDD